MEKTSILVIGFLLFFSILSISNSSKQAVENGIVNWFYNFDEGLNAAQDSKSHVLLNFYTDRCGWCTKLDQEIYTNNDAITLLNEKLICIKIDADVNNTLREKFNVCFCSLPTTVFLTSDGKEVGRIEGYTPLNQYVDYVIKIVNHFS